MIENIQMMIPAEFWKETRSRLTDSMPIIVAQHGRRFSARIYPEIADKDDYCATKNLLILLWN